MLNIFCGFVLFIAGILPMTYGDTFEQCEGITQMYVALQEDCSFYIFCHDEDSFSDACPDDSPYFSVEEQTCDTDNSVCKDRPILIETTIPTTVKELISDNSTAYSFTPTVTFTDNNTYSPTAVTLSSANISATATATTLQTVSTASTAAVMPSSCPSIDNPNKAIFLPHSKSCSEYYLCYRGERLPMRCSNMLHFDVRQQRCDYPEKVKCHLMDIVSPREQCLSHTFDFYPHPKNCNYYYQCTLGYLKVMQCPLHMGWHYEKRACVMRSQVKCYNYFARSMF